MLVAKPDLRMPLFIDDWGMSLVGLCSIFAMPLLSLWFVYGLSIV